MDPLKDISATPPPVPTPLEIMRQAYRNMDLTFQEDDGVIFTQLRLEKCEVCVISWGNPNGLAIIAVRLPVSAPPEYRAAAGEFLHRLNYNAKRKFWEIDYNDGEIRLSVYTDTLLGPLTDGFFRSMLHCLLMTADAVFPYLMSVLTGRMNPEFANDQAEAALVELWNSGET